MSWLGVVSLGVLGVCAGMLAMHHQLMRVRAPLDGALDVLETALRQRLEHILMFAASAPDCEGLLALCEQHIDAETDSLLAALPRLRQAVEPLRPTLANMPELEENAAELATAQAAYHEAITAYNAFVARQPWRTAAWLLRLSREVPVDAAL